MVISVDTGNKMIKTEHYEFNSGIDVLDTIPGENDEVIEFGGKYYRTTNRRISYMEDKTEDDRYYILTLIAIAKELDTMKKEAVLAPNELIEIELLVGLPPAHYGKYRKKFQQYFQRDGKVVGFKYGGTSYQILIHEVKVYVQAYAAYCVLAARRHLTELPKVLVIDIGGFTVDYMILRYGRLEKEHVDSLESGVICLYGRIRAAIRQKYSIALDEEDIDNIILGKNTGYMQELKERVREVTIGYVTELLGTFRELGIDFRTTQTVFMGGGAILVSEIIKVVWERFKGEYFIINDPKANIDSMSATSETMSGINAMSVKDDAEAFAGAVSESNSEGETLLDVSGGEQDLAIPAASNVSANGFSESGSEHGILGEMGDYPVEEEMSDFDSEMDLESGSIEMTGQESMSYGKTGTAYNSSVSGEVSNAGEGLGSEIMSALQGNGVSSVNQEKGILDEVGTSSVFGFDAAPRAGMNYNENSMPTGMESMSENGIQSDGIMDTGEDLDEETDEADFYAKSAMGILVDTAGNPLKAENTKLSDPGMQNEDDIQPVADETGMAADGFMNVSGSIPTGDISLKRSRPDTRRIREVPKSRAELKEKGSDRLR